MRHRALADKLAKYDVEREAPEYATHLDAWTNALTGIGTSRDKVTATAFQGGTGCLLPSQLEDLYHNDDIAARICDLIPETCLREPFLLSDEQLAKDFDALGACEKFADGWTFGRLHGGGPIILGGDGPSDQPLTTGVNSLMLVDRWAISPWKYYSDTKSGKYGEPEIYRITRPRHMGPGNLVDDDPEPNEQIHESRVIVFPGARTSPRRKRAQMYWDDSVIQRVYQVIQGYGLTWASVTHLLQDAAQGVYSMKDLWNMIVGGNKAAVEERMAMVDEQRSSARAILVDAEHENFTRVPTPFAGVAELIDRFSERLASASGYPLTVLMGSSPSGMNATGQSDLEIYYGRCEAQRRRVLTPAILKLAAAMGHDTKKLTIKYPPLWMPSADEQAKTRYAIAQTDNIYHEMGLKADKILTSRFGHNGWTPDMTVEAGDIEDPADRAINAPPPVAGAPGAAPGAKKKPAVARAGETAGTSIGTRHYSPKYGR